MGGLAVRRRVLSSIPVLDGLIDFSLEAKALATEALGPEIERTITDRPQHDPFSQEFPDRTWVLDEAVEKNFEFAGRFLTIV